MPITKRLVKAAPLTAAEHDENMDVVLRGHFPSVTALMQDSRGYSAPNAFVAGEVIDAGGVHYVVAPATVTNHHATTAGGAKLYEDGVHFTTLNNFRAKIARQDTYRPGDVVTAEGVSYAKTGGNTITGLPGWAPVVASGGSVPAEVTTQLAALEAQDTSILSTLGTLGTKVNTDIENRVVALEGTSGSGTMVFPSYLVTELQDPNHPVNTTGKTVGKIVWDDSNKRLVRADGTAVTSIWRFVDGEGFITPSGAVVLPPPSNFTWLAIPQTNNGDITVGGRNWKFNTALLPHSITRLDGVGNADWLKFHVRDGDMRAGDPADRHRSELSGSDFPFSGVDQQELWVSQWYIPLQQSSCWFNASFQLFDVGYNSPSLKIEERGGTGQEINVAGGLTSTRTQTPAWQGPRFQSRTRYHRVWRIVQDGQYGRVTLWVNSVQIYDVQNVPIGRGTDPQAYLKYGIYADDNLAPMGDQEVIFGPMIIQTGTNALLSHVTTPPAIPAILATAFPTGEFPLSAGRVVLENGLPPGGVDPGANLITSLSPPTLESTNGSGVFSYNATTRTLSLRGTDVSWGARCIFAIQTVAGETYQIAGSLSTTSMNTRVGTTSGGTEILANLVHQPGPLGRSWTGDGTVHYLMFNKQSSANTAVLSNITLTGPA